MPRLFSYVVDHDEGRAPNPYFGVCTLCRCKFRDSCDKPRNIVEKAKEGDWVIGTGGANLKKSTGHGTLIYAMRVDKRMTRQQYFLNRRFGKKKPRKNGTYEQAMGDNIRPRTSFEKHGQFVLVSHHFYYFGRKAISIHKSRFPDLEKNGPWYRSDFKEAYITRFVKWLETDTGFRPGKHGDPYMKKVEPPSKRKGAEICKSSC